MKAFFGNMTEEREVIETVRRRRINPWLIVGLVAAIAIGILLASTIWTGRFSGKGNVAENSVLPVKKQADPQAWCASQATYDAMKRELFRRAAQVRGSDDQLYARLSDFALLRLNGPIVRGVDDQLNSVSCGGTAVLQLPPGVQVSDGRRSLSADVDYMIEPAADGTGNVVRLGNADGIVIPLATLSRQAQSQPAAPAAGEATNQASGNEAATAPSAPPPQAQPAPAHTTPSFDCDHASNNVEFAICSDAGLAALDREMAADFQRAMSSGDSGERKLLERTRKRFLSFRNRCVTNQCIEETYQSRIREIGDIMTGRWRG
jgi:uncharacterized protein YecT (DUF1311 family)